MKQKTTELLNSIFEIKANSKTKRGDFGIKTFTTFFNSNKKNDTGWIEAVCVNYNQKIMVEYNDKLSEIKNHQMAVRKLIEKYKIEVKNCHGFPVLGKDVDFIFFNDCPELVESTIAYSFKI